MTSLVNLVEIDLLRGGEHSTAVPKELALAECGVFDYHVCIHLFGEIETFHVYPMLIEEPLAIFEIPLLTGDPGVLLDLQAVFDRCYDAGPYSREIDYSKTDVIPPLQPERGAWLRGVLSASN